MRSSWRRSTALILALTVAMLLGLAGLASAEVSQVTVTSPTSDARVYAKIGTVVRVTATVTTTSETGKVWMKTGVGNCVSNIDYVEVGTGSGSYYCDVKIIAGATEGWVNVSAQAYQEDVPGGSGTPKAHAQTSAVFVDIEAPSVPGAFATNPTSPGNDDTPTWSWAGSTDQGTSQSGMDHYKVQIASSTTSDSAGFGDWADADPATVPHPGSGDPSWTADPALTAGGWYKIRVCAVDKAGNESAYTGDSGVYQFDNKAPTLPGAAAVDPASPSRTNSTPVWTWDASSDATPPAWQTGLHDVNPYQVEHTQNGVVQGTVDRLNPTWTLTVTEGLHKIRVRAVDAAGNETAWVPGADYCYDLHAPSMGTFTNPTSPGTNKTPTWTWTADDGQYGSGIKATGGYYVEVSNNNGSSWDFDTDNVTNPSWTPGVDLADGSYIIRVSATDAAGNTSAGDTSGTYTLDSTPPDNVGTISVPEPNPGNNKRPAWSWARPSDGTGTGVSAYHVEISRDGDPYAAADPALVQTTAATAAWSPSADLADGLYKIRVRAQDAAGNQSADWTAAASDYQLDATKPVIDTDSWHPVNDSWIGSSTYTVGADITDPMGEGGTYSSGLNKGAGSLAINLSPGATVGVETWSVDTPQIPLSNLVDLTEYTLKVDIKDNAGNAAVQGVLKFHVDLSGPTFADESPADGLETNDVNIQPHIGIEDDGSGVNSDRIYWTMKDPGGNGLAGLEDWQWVTPPGEPWSGVATFQPLPALSMDGYYDLQVYAQDTVGHGSTYPESPETWKFLLDTVKPEVDIELNAYRDIGGAIYTPRNGDTGTELVLTVVATDPGTFPSGFNADGTLTVEVYDNAGTPITGSTTLNPNPRPSLNTEPWTVTWIPSVVLPDGKYYVKAVATDDAGNETTDETFSFIVDTKAPDIEGNAAEVGFLNTSNNKRFTNSREIEVTWGKTLDPRAGNEPGSGLLGYKFEIHAKVEGASYNAADKLCDDYSDTDNVPELGVPVAYLKPTVGDTELWTAGPLGFETGKSYGAWIKAIDKVHNTSEWFDPPFIFDVDEPTAPQDAEIQGLKNALTDRRTNDSTPTLEWKHSTDIQLWAQSGVDLYEVQIDRAGTATWDIRHEVYIFPVEDVVDPLNPAHGLSGPFTWTVPLKLSDGAYVVRVRAKDVAGNYSEWEFTEGFIIDATPPEMPGIPEPEATPTNARKPTWTWKPSVGAVSYNVYLDDNGPINLTAAEFTEGDYPYEPAELSEGTHHLRVTALDDLGNESRVRGTGHVVIDRTEPEAPIMLDLPAYTNATNTIRLIWAAEGDAVKYMVSYSIGTVHGVVPDHRLQALDLDISSAVDGDRISAAVMAWDAAGNPSSWSNRAETTVDRSKPYVTAVSPTEPVRTTNPRPTWTWEGHDQVSGVAHYIVTVGNEPPFTTTGTSFTPSSPLAHGGHVVTVAAVDLAGNKSENPLVFKEVFVDTVPPAAPAIKPLEPAYTNLSGETTRTIDIEWNQIADTPNAITYRLQWADNEGFSDPTIETIAGIAGTSQSFTFPRDGGYWFRVKAISTVAPTLLPQTKESEWSPIVSTVYDTIGPVAPDLTLRSKSPTNQPTQEWGWSRPVDAVNYDVYWHTTEDTPPDVVSPTDPNADLEVGNVDQYYTHFKHTNLNEEYVEYHVWVRGIDALGNKGLWSNMASVRIDMKPPAAPQNLALWPSDELPMGEDLLLFTSSNRPGVTWDPVSDAVAYRVSVDGHTYLPTDQSSWLWPTAHDSECLGDGPHLVVVRAIDEAGNESIPEAPGPSAYSGGGWLWFIVDTTGPEKPGMPSTTKSPTNNSTPEWTWAPSSVDPEATEPDDMLSGFSHYNVYLDGELVVLDEEDEPITEPAFQCELTDGLHVLEVTSVDRLGNESERSTAGHVLVDTVDPTPPVMKVLPPFTNAATVRFEWTKSSADTDHYEISYTVGDGEEWSDPLEVAGEFYVVDISDVRDGVAVTGKVRAYDKAGNKSVWSNELLGAPIASTIVDRTGPEVTITKPTEAVITNAAKFRYEWTAIDAGCGVASYTVEFNGSRHQVDETSVDNKYWYEATLIEGDNTFKVFATDKLGNVGGTKAAAIVKQVKPQIILVQPMPGAKYKINEISTIAFQVIGLVVDEESQYIRPEILVNGEPLADWRIVPVVEPPGTAKFYVLLDADVMVPGTMGIRITVGAGSELFSYTVDSERSGFGFGRLRPW